LIYDGTSSSRHSSPPNFVKLPFLDSFSIALSRVPFSSHAYGALFLIPSPDSSFAKISRAINLFCYQNAYLERNDFQVKLTISSI
jgi:hypothetical protein